MDAEKFAFYIKNPAHLYQITYSELKGLIQQYPYCQNLRYLLLKKSILDKHADLDKNLQLAATFSNDRDLLYRQVKEGDTYISEADSFLLKEDYIELKALDLQNPEVNPNQIDSLGLAEATFDEAESSAKDTTTISNIEEQKVEAKSEEADTVHSNPPEELMEEQVYQLEDIEEEEFDDITEEYVDFFNEADGDLEIVVPESKASEATTASEEEKKATESELEDPASDVDIDESISIEELIKLDTLTPLEREEAKIKKEKKPKEIIENQEEKSFDFEAIDALIEKTKKDVPLEIINEESLDIKETPDAPPVSEKTFTSWLKEVQSGGVNSEEEETINQEKRKPEVTKKKKGSEIKEKKKKKSSPKKQKNQSGKEKKKIKKSKAKSGNTPKKAKVVAKESLMENEEIVSETLANLLVKQENYKKAIKMYEKLSLIFPEKSSYFADQIEKLKNL